MNEILCTIRTPNACTPFELQEFLSFVLKGGEVSPIGLLKRIQRAHTLAFLYSNKNIIGVAGLKWPSINHCHELSINSGIILHKIFPLELGWVYILPSARGGKLSNVLCRSLIEASANSGIFATSRSSNIAMHKTLGNHGFIQVGKEWLSQQSSDNLCLFTRSVQKKAL